MIIHHDSVAACLSIVTGRIHGGCQPKVAQGNFRIADRL
jgi:hypothetical protein